MSRYKVKYQWWDLWTNTPKGEPGEQIINTTEDQAYDGAENPEDIKRIFINRGSVKDPAHNIELKVIEVNLLE